MVSEAARRFAAKRGLALAYPPSPHPAGDVGDMGDAASNTLKNLLVLPCAGVAHPVAGSGYMGDSADRPRPVPPVGEGSVTHVTQGLHGVGDGPKASKVVDFRGPVGGVTHVTRVTQPNEEVGPSAPPSRGGVPGLLPAARRAEPDGPVVGPQETLRRRPPAWPDASTSPGAGDACSCCRGRWWWGDAGGWRCWTCHPPVHVPADKRGLLREART